MKIVVTGGAGFIGSNLVKRLVEDGHDVTVIDNLSAAHIKNICHHKKSDNFNFIKGDVLDYELINNAVKDKDVIFHEAAITSVPYSIKHPILTNEINVKGTLMLLESCLNSDVERFIFASSAAVYGGQKFSLLREDMVPNQKCPYSVSKFTSENYAKLYFELYGLNTICLRYFNVYGPRARIDQGVISVFINKILNDMNPIIYGDGEQTRDFISVHDVVEANILALYSKKAVGEIINIGTGIKISINTLINIISKISNKKNVKPIYSNPRQGENKHGYADINKARKLLRFNPKITIRKGITELVDWYRT